MARQQLPDPLVPPEVDLNGLEFMPMKHLKVLQSTLFVKSTGDEFKAAFALWCASWTEVPAASLPDDEVMLEHLSRSKVWKRVRSRALHGWVKCADGRLYHPVIAGLAIRVWERDIGLEAEEEPRETRQQRWRAKLKRLASSLVEVGIRPRPGATVNELLALCRAHLPDFDEQSAPGWRRLDVSAVEWSRLREAVFARDNYRCRYCGDQSGRRLECDHVIPVAAGGLSTLDNLVTSCFSCNKSKGTKSLEQWHGSAT